MRRICSWRLGGRCHFHDLRITMTLLLKTPHGKSFFAGPIPFQIWAFQEEGENGYLQTRRHSLGHRTENMLQESGALWNVTELSSGTVKVVSVELTVLCFGHDVQHESHRTTDRNTEKKMERLDEIERYRGNNSYLCGKHGDYLAAIVYIHKI